LDPACRDVTKILHEGSLEPNSTIEQLQERILWMANYAEPLEKSVKLHDNDSIGKVHEGKASYRI
jgi:hypothetical protein